MATINYKNTSVKLAENVYEPAEDSFLLANAALDITIDGMQILEIGTGSGFVSAILQANKDIRLIATEINPFAAKCARSNGIEVIRTDMFAGIKDKKHFDMIIFNPPYLPTSEDEKVPGWLNYAFDGGITGRDSIKPFFRNVKKYLRSEGIILLLISSLTGIDEVKKEISDFDFDSQIIAREKCSFEELVVLKCNTRKN
ncbi:HemK2/MTQ2 family protein methyltransferase [Methanolobus sp. ZRKC3]|uniref:HemK2/MTQ2 family protein methyltransferase n=1 Tax=Methanolobus sp. ZRKC3 TaxID=3125786 RepID=UPI003251FC9E